jgi:hypothetical protein
MEKKLNIGIGMCACFVIVSLFLISIGGPVSYGVDGAYIEKEIVTPGSCPGLVLTTAQFALSVVNQKLGTMTYGDIHTINGTRLDAALIKNYKMGSIVYWELTDELVTVDINGYSQEIIHYTINSDIQTGTLNQGQITTLANNIASQFCPLPADKGTVAVSFEHFGMIFTSDMTDNLTDPNVYNYSVDTDCTNQTMWCAKWFRYKNSIESTDCIIEYIDGNGNLQNYYKDWNMNLGSLSTSYSVTQTSAENLAKSFIGINNVSVLNTNKMICRPNKIFEGNGTYQYGNNPKCIWVVRIRDLLPAMNLTTYTIHVDGVNGAIVGGATHVILKTTEDMSSPDYPTIEDPDWGDEGW